MTRRNERAPREKRKVEASGRTIDDAVAAASAMLKVPEDELDIEVVDEGRGGFLGLGSKEAVVRAAVKRRRSRGREEGRGRRRDSGNYDRGERGERGGRSQGGPDRSERPARPDRPERPERPERSRRDRNDRSDSGRDDRGRGRDRSEDPMAVNVVGRDDDRGRGRRGGRGGRNNDESSRPTQSRSGDRTRSDRGRSDRPRRGDRPVAEYDKALEENIRLFISGLLERMGFPCDVSASFADGAYQVQVNAGEDDSLLIGRKGETLDALQHVAYKMASRGREESATIKIDISGYRERREGELAEEAREMAMEVKDTGRTRQTEPLRAAERRIIHRAITDIEGVTTRAIGTGLVKKIVIQLESDDDVQVDDRPSDDTRSDRRETESRRAPQERTPEPAVSGEVLDFVSSPVFSGDKPAAPEVASAPAEPSAFGRRARPSKKRRR